MPDPNTSCKFCKNNFYAKPSHLKQGFGIYCSASCHYQGARNGKTIECTVCGEKSYKAKKVLKRSKSGKFFCSKSCQTMWRNSVYIQEKHPNWKGGKYAYKSVLIRHNVPPICTLCSSKDERILAVHHIDKNRKNNKVENLAWLCHNCHRLVHCDRVEKQKFMEGQ